MIALYVDTLLIACIDLTRLSEIKAALEKTFRMKDLNEACQCLIFDASRNTKTGSLWLAQKWYTEEIFTPSKTDEADGFHTHMDTNIDSICSDETEVDLAYREAIVCSTHFMVGIRPEIGFAVRRVAKFVKKPIGLHWYAVNGVMRYLGSTKEYGLQYKSDEDIEPIGYVDSDYTEDLSSRKSASGYVFTVAGATISWCSRLREMNALLLTESEYVSLTSRTK